MRHLIELKRVAHALPWELGTLYVMHSSGAWPWLTREGPRGRGRELWVDVEQLSLWASARSARCRRVPLRFFEEVQCLSSTAANFNDITAPSVASTRKRDAGPAGGHYGEN